jgi:hypothetical protein
VKGCLSNLSNFSLMCGLAWSSQLLQAHGSASKAGWSIAKVVNAPDTGMPCSSALESCTIR